MVSPLLQAWRNAQARAELFDGLNVRDRLPTSSRKPSVGALKTDETRLQEQWLGANQANNR